eukprot:10134917-Karenia_brevis.AAC.1
MIVNCGALRFIFTNQIEATGAERICQLEHNVRFHSPSKSPFRYDAAGKVRVFGGVNVLFLGDFWQLRPTGQ